MSTGSQVNAIALQLEKVLGEVRQATLNVLAKGKAPSIGNPSDAPYFERLEAWAERVQSLAAHLARLRVGLEGQRNLLPVGGRTAEARSMAFRAHQSIEDQASTVERAQALAAQTSLELERLLDRSIYLRGTDHERLTGDLAGKALDFAKKLGALEAKIAKAESMHTVEHGAASQLRTAVGQARTQFISAARPAAPAPDYIGMATLLLTLLRILWLERLRASKARST